MHTEKELQQSFLIQQTLSKIDGEKEETGEALRTSHYLLLVFLTVFEEEKVRRRKMLALELLETERSYVTQLGCVLKVYHYQSRGTNSEPTFPLSCPLVVSRTAARGEHIKEAPHIVDRSEKHIWGCRGIRKTITFLFPECYLLLFRSFII